ATTEIYTLSLHDALPILVSDIVAQRPTRLQQRNKFMHYIKIKRVIGLVVLLIVAGVALASIPAARATDDYQPPVLPSPTCDNLQAPPGNEVAFHAYARGVQIYRWNGSSWGFVAPDARLFASANYQGEIGIHYAGPT